MMIVELKSDALKERHWKLLMKQLRVNWVLSDLTLGQVWDVNLQQNESVVKDIILVAQGEMALEEFLKQVYMIHLFSFFKRIYRICDRTFLTRIYPPKLGCGLYTEFRKITQILREKAGYHTDD
jgi:hypothetical protein